MCCIFKSRKRLSTNNKETKVAMTRRMVSLKDISKACGVSVATVSKALNDHSDIGKETKERIREVAEQLGYRPNAAAQALKTNRSNNIGVLFVDEANSGLTHDYFNHVLDSFKRTAEENGFDITFINGGKARINNMSYLSHAIYRGFDGVMIACVDFSDPEVDELVKSNIPVVTIDHLFYNRIAVVSDNVSGMKELVKYELNVWLVVLFATIGADLGASINYIVALYVGRPVIYKFANSKWGKMCLLNQKKVEKSEKYFDDHGVVATLTGRLIPGIRHLISIPAGLARMTYWKFLLYTTIGAGCWHAILAAMGWYLATIVPEDQLEETIEHYNHYIVGGILALVALAIVYFVAKHFITKKH